LERFKEKKSPLMKASQPCLGEAANVSEKRERTKERGSKKLEKRKKKTPRRRGKEKKTKAQRDDRGNLEQKLEGRHICSEAEKVGGSKPR